jgi:hypothetical protein
LGLKGYSALGLGHTNWTDKFWGIFGGIISTILAVESLVHGRMDWVVFPTKKLIFRHIYIPNITQI